MNVYRLRVMRECGLLVLWHLPWNHHGFSFFFLSHLVVSTRSFQAQDDDHRIGLTYWKAAPWPAAWLALHLEPLRNQDCRGWHVGEDPGEAIKVPAAELAHA